MHAIVVAIALLAAALSPRVAEATFPYPTPPAGTPPQNYAAYCFLPTTSPPVRPSDFTGGTLWKLGSDQTGNPSIDANPAELFGVTGMSVDLAWQVTTGRPDVTIAVLDSGIRWAENVGDIENKFYLNARELPVPETDFNLGHNYDANGDGVFNLRDYDGDARVS